MHRAHGPRRLHGLVAVGASGRRLLILMRGRWQRAQRLIAATVTTATGAARQTADEQWTSQRSLLRSEGSRLSTTLMVDGGYTAL